MTYLDAFNNCLTGPWKTSGLDVQYKIDDEGRLFFLCTSRKEDWKYNFDFFPAPAAPYKDMPFSWFAHGGFIALWKSVSDEILHAFAGGLPTLIAGYSQGAAIATLAHEAFYFETGLFPRTLAFASPRVIWASPGLDKRFEGLHNIYVKGDIVHHVPFALLGFHHIGTTECFGPPALIRPFNHTPEQYRKYLKEAV